VEIPHSVKRPRYGNDFPYAAMAMGDGGHHAGQGGAGDFCGCYDRTYCLRLHFHSEAKKGP
jgi:hypothetical protein